MNLRAHQNLFDSGIFNNRTYKKNDYKRAKVAYQRIEIENKFPKLKICRTFYIFEMYRESKNFQKIEKMSSVG